MPNPQTFTQQEVRLAASVSPIGPQRYRLVTGEVHAFDFTEMLTAYADLLDLLQRIRPQLQQIRNDCAYRNFAEQVEFMDALLTNGTKE